MLLTVTERTEQLHHDNAPAHSAALVKAFLAKHHITQVCPPLQPRFGSLRLMTFPKTKIAVEREEICECDGHTVHKLSHQRLTADWLAPRENDCSGWTVRSPLTGCQVTSRPRDRFSRYSKWTDTCLKWRCRLLVSHLIVSLVYVSLFERERSANCHWVIISRHNS
jgi:hypothetical protein